MLISYISFAIVNFKQKSNSCQVIACSLKKQLEILSNRELWVRGIIVA